jgi:hypothetical protein
MDKDRRYFETEMTFSDAISDEIEALYCDPLERESETGEERFVPKNKVKKQNNEKNQEN